MKHDEHGAFVGTTAVTLLAIVAFLCIVAGPSAAHEIQSIEVCAAGSWADAAALQGAPQ